METEKRTQQVGVGNGDGSITAVQHEGDVDTPLVLLFVLCCGYFWYRSFFCPPPQTPKNQNYVNRATIIERITFQLLRISLVASPASLTSVACLQ